MTVFFNTSCDNNFVIAYFFTCIYQMMSVCDKYFVFYCIQYWIFLIVSFVKQACSYCIFIIRSFTLTEIEGRHIVFGSNPVGICIIVASWLHSVFWTSGWILTKLAQTHCFDFGDLGIIFKVTPALCQMLTKKACLHPISWTNLRVSDQTSCTYISLG